MAEWVRVAKLNRAGEFIQPLKTGAGLFQLHQRLPPGGERGLAGAKAAVEPQGGVTEIHRFPGMNEDQQRGRWAAEPGPADPPRQTQHRGGGRHGHADEARLRVEPMIRPELVARDRGVDPKPVRHEPGKVRGGKPEIRRAETDHRPELALVALYAALGGPRALPSPG